MLSRSRSQPYRVGWNTQPTSFEELNRRLGTAFTSIDEMLQILFDDLKIVDDSEVAHTAATAATLVTISGASRQTPGVPGDAGGDGEGGVPGLPGLRGLDGAPGIPGQDGADAGAPEMIMIASGGGTPGGANADVQYNNNGLFGGRALPQFGYWSPLSGVDGINPELIYDINGDTIAVFTSTV